MWLSFKLHGGSFSERQMGMFQNIPYSTERGLFPEDCAVILK